MQQKYKVFINSDGVTEDNPLSVELIDELSRPIPGYSRKLSGVINTDGVRQKVIWPKNNSIHFNRDKPFAVRVNFPAKGNVRLYSIYVQEE